MAGRRAADDWDDVYDSPTIQRRLCVSGELARPPLVLIADDDADTREMYAEYLAYLGCRVLVATNGEHALRLALTSQPDLILLDGWMPQMDGCEATKRLRADARTATTPILGLSALGEEWQNQMMAVGCSVALPKPIQIAELERVVRSLLPSLATSTPPNSAGAGRSTTSA